MAAAFLHTPCPTSDSHMPVAPPEAFEDSEDSEDNTCRDGMPESHRSKCSVETAWDIHNTYRNIHNRHSSDELRIEVRCHRRTRIGVRCRRHTHTCLIPDSFVAYVNISHQGLVAVVERQSLSPKSLPRSQFHFRMVSQTPQFRSQKAVLEQKS